MLLDFKEKLELIKKEHSKATHHCFAYRIGLDGNNFRVADDGEPSGSAGRPILGQIDSKQLCNVLIIVVRYFGGTLLGVPGLINAYKTAASLCFAVYTDCSKTCPCSLPLQFDYTQLHNVMKILKQAGCSIFEQDIQLFCVVSVGIAQNKSEEVLNKLRDINGVEIAKAQVPQ